MTTMRTLSWLAAAALALLAIAPRAARADGSSREQAKAPAAFAEPSHDGAASGPKPRAPSEPFEKPKDGATPGQAAPGPARAEGDRDGDRGALIASLAVVAALCAAYFAAMRDRPGVKSAKDS